jgi:NADH-quinone oxidoreductase subunit E
MLRRLYPEQPAGFAFTEATLDWARGQIAKYPAGRQASAIIPLLWRAQEQEGWLTRPAIEEVARMLDMAPIRALEVATFYFMFQLQPVGSVAHIQICGTTSCMLCGSEGLIDIARQRSGDPFQLSPDGKFSWEEVECLGACANAPVVQIGKDYYEDLTPEGFAAILDAFARGEVPRPGPQNGRFASEPLGGLTSLEAERRTEDANASVALALALGDTVMRITGEEAPVRISAAAEPMRPAGRGAAREGGADDLKRIKGVGPKLEALLHALGFYHFDQIAGWTAAELAWVDEHLEGFRGRASRDEWIAQARLLAAGGETEFSRRVDEGDVY